MANTSPTTRANAELQECIDNCAIGHDVCVETTTFCLELGGRHADADHIRLLLDCAEI